MLKNVRLVMLGEDPEQSITIAIPISSSPLLAHSIDFLMGYPAGSPNMEVIHLNGGRSKLSFSMERIHSLLPPRPEGVDEVVSKSLVQKDLQQYAEICAMLSDFVGEVHDERNGVGAVDVARRVLSELKERRAIAIRESQMKDAHDGNGIIAAPAAVPESSPAPEPQAPETGATAPPQTAAPGAD